MPVTMRVLRQSARIAGIAVLLAVVVVGWYDYRHVYVPLKSARAIQETKSQLASVQENKSNQMFLATYGPTLPVHLAQTLESSSPGAVHSPALLVAKGLLLDLHTSQNEQMALVLQQGYFGAGAYGISDASLAYFQKTLSQCSDYEVASLVAMFKAPGAYTVGSDHLRRRTELVLSKYRN